MSHRFLALERELGAWSVRQQSLALRRRRRRAFPRALSGPRSTPQQALAEIRKFAARTSSSSWKLSRGDVASRLEQLVQSPDLLSQGSLNLCGPAALFRVWLARDPLAVAKYAAALYDNRKGSLGTLEVKPGDDLVKQDYAGIRTRLGSDCPPADWMMMGALRDSENGLFDFEGTPEESASGLTTPAEMASWLKAVGHFAKVRDEGNWVATKGVDHALRLAPGPERDVVLLIHAHILSDAVNHKNKAKELLAGFPNHYVVLLSPIVARADGKLGFSLWTWGYSPLSVAIERSAFSANYYGAVIAES